MPRAPYKLSGVPAMSSVACHNNHNTTTSNNNNTTHTIYHEYILQTSPTSNSQQWLRPSMAVRIDIEQQQQQLQQQQQHQQHQQQQQQQRQQQQQQQQQRI
ncbi:unnamed protein product [Polarella glacialis]|uniref:Uncharacterized protein n=1 Tax=Polarella glacialis TaxID=89957 RepID=A0A813GCT8_POLGL|nr:unnamed protein product [Polarella glacialis]